VHRRHIPSLGYDFAHQLIKQPTRSAYFLSGRNWNSGLVRPKANPLSCGAIWKAESTSSSSSWQLGRTRQHKRFSRRACTGRCMKENTRQRSIVSPTLIFKSLSTSQFAASLALMAQTHVRFQGLQNRRSRNPNNHHHERKPPSPTPLPR
jgi:hypothetical protein